MNLNLGGPICKNCFGRSYILYTLSSNFETTIFLCIVLRYRLLLNNLHEIKKSDDCIRIKKLFYYSGRCLSPSIRTCVSTIARKVGSYIYAALCGQRQLQMPNLMEFFSPHGSETINFLCLLQL